MNRNMENSKEGWNYLRKYAYIFLLRTFQNISFILKAFWLVFLYIASTWLVLATLTSQLFQEKVNLKINPNTNKHYSVANLINLTEQYDAGLIKLKELQLKVREQEKDVVRMDDTLKKLRKQRESIIGEFEELSTRLNNEFKIVVTSWSQLRALLKQKLAQEQIDDQMEIHNNIRAIQRSSTNHNDMLTRLVAETRNLSQNQKKQTDAENGVIKAIQELVVAIQEHQKSQDVIKQIDDEHLKDLLVELRYLTNLKFHYLATMPNQLLTLILTLSMGALGSTIFLTKELFNPVAKNRSLNWYLFRPFLGMVTAIAIFVLVKSGQIVITYNTSVEQKMSEALNPFFVSFLAIISGLLSEHAYEKIYRAGKKFFDYEDKPDLRWGVGLRKELDQQEKTAEELSKIIGTPPEIIKDWIAEKRAIPLNEQKIISAWLSTPGRNLFTDIPPQDQQQENKEG